MFVYYSISPGEVKRKKGNDPLSDLRRHIFKLLPFSILRYVLHSDIHTFALDTIEITHSPESPIDMYQ